MRKALVITLGAALIALASVAAACGASSPSASSSTAPPATAGGMTAAQILTRSQHAMSKVGSARFAAEVTFKVGAIGSSGPAALLGQTAIDLRVLGQVGGSKKTSAANVSLMLQVAGQQSRYAVKESDKHVWVRYQGKWYVAPASKTSKTSAVGSSKSSGSAKAGLGIGPVSRAASSTVANEKLNGVAVYHVTTTADTAKVMSALIKALNAPGLAKSVGSGAAVLDQLKSLEKALASASVQYWVDASTFLVRKGTVDARLKFGGATAASGVSGLSVNVNYVLSHFGEPVQVTPPKHALPLTSLTHSLSPLADGIGV
jgi:hypothetical protein